MSSKAAMLMPTPIPTLDPVLSSMRSGAWGAIVDSDVEVGLGPVDAALSSAVAEMSVETASLLSVTLLIEFEGSDAVAAMPKVATVCASDKLLASDTDAAAESAEAEAESTLIMLTNEARSSLPMVAKAGGLSPVTGVGKATYCLVRLVVRWLCWTT